MLTRSYFENVLRLGIQPHTQIPCRSREARNKWVGEASRFQTESELIKRSHAQTEAARGKPDLSQTLCTQEPFPEPRSHWQEIVISRVCLSFLYTLPGFVSLPLCRTPQTAQLEITSSPFRQCQRLSSIRKTVGHPQAEKHRICSSATPSSGVWEHP